MSARIIDPEQIDALRRVLAVEAVAQDLLRAIWDAGDDPFEDGRVFTVPSDAINRLADVCSLSGDAHDDRRLAALIGDGG